MIDATAHCQLTVAEVVGCVVSGWRLGAHLHRRLCAGVPWRRGDGPGTAHQDHTGTDLKIN